MLNAVSQAPPAGGEDPLGIGVEEPPGADEGSDDEEAEYLVAAGELALPVAGLLFGLLFEVGLDVECGQRTFSMMLISASNAAFNKSAGASRDLQRQSPYLENWPN